MSNSDIEGLEKLNISYKDDELDDQLSESETNEKINTEINEENKYTKIDNLDEDPVLTKQKFACISFVSPEGVMNTSIRAVKIRGVYETHEEAIKRCEELKSIDKYFDVFVGEVGKWLAWDPDPHTCENTVYRDEKQDKIMKQNMNNNKMNELVGRKKEILEKGWESENRRVADKIISGTSEKGSSSYDNKKVLDKTLKEKKLKSKQIKADNLEKLKEKMRKTLNDRKLKKDEPETNKDEDLKIFLENNKKVIEEEEKKIVEKEETLDKIEENIDKIKKYLNQKEK